MVAKKKYEWSKISVAATWATFLEIRDLTNTVVKSESKGNKRIECLNTTFLDF